MATQGRNWIRDILIVPLIVGIIVAFVEFGLPVLTDSKKELSYEIYPPIKFIDRDAIGDIDLTVYVNDVETGLIEILRARVWNSGDVPLKKLPISYVFAPHSQYTDTFKVLNITHETEPRHEFGEIAAKPGTRTKKSFEYELLNDGDEFTATFVANAPGTLAVYTKVEGMEVKHVTAGATTEGAWVWMTAMLFAFFAMVVYWMSRNVSTLLRRLTRQ